MRLSTDPSVSLSGSYPAKINKQGLNVEEVRDDNSGVHDFPPGEADKYVAYPEIVDVVAHNHKVLKQLERVSDEEITIGGDILRSGIVTAS